MQILEKKLILKINLLYRFINQGNLLKKKKKKMCANCSLKLRCYKDVIYYTFYSTNKLKEVHLRAYFELLMVKQMQLLNILM